MHWHFEKRKSSDVRHKLFMTLWLRHCATNWKVAGSIPDEVIFLYLSNLFRRTGPCGLSASNRNEYQKHQNNNVSGE
jgi:hypothetical protein